MAVSELLWFLLPVAAGAGWVAAKRSEAKRPEAFWDYTRHFHQGLNVLLSEQQDKAFAHFDSLSGALRDTADTHIALGNLFRRQGEVERAILLHQGVVDKIELPEEVRATAHFELGRDYDSAGLLDRSEQVFRELLESAYRRDDAFECLLQQHEREHDWKQAIMVAIDYERSSDLHLHARIAHYYCELAVASEKQGCVAEAADFLAHARRHDPLCARVLMMQASGALLLGDYERAVTLYEEVEAIRPELMPQIIDSHFAALKAIADQERLLSFIKRIREQRNAYSVIRSTREVIAELHSDELADRFFKDQILRRPSLKGLRDWARDQLALSKPGERGKVQVICDLLDQVVEDKPVHRCGACGFQGNVMHWRCPSCGQWDTVSTIIGIEGE